MMQLSPGVSCISSVWEKAIMSKKLFVGNLPFSSTEDSIKELFSRFGEVLSVKIPTDRISGRSRGFGFVEMENADAAVSELNNFFIEGRNIKVDFAQERSRGNRAGFKKGRNRSKPH